MKAKCDSDTDVHGLWVPTAGVDNAATILRDGIGGPDLGQSPAMVAEVDRVTEDGW